MIYLKCLIFFAICVFSGVRTEDDLDDWKGRWFPHPPGTENTSELEEDEDIKDDLHGVEMGVPSSCDDGNMNLSVDWDNSPINYTCFENKIDYLPNPNTHPILHRDYVPKQYVAQHKCMDTPIYYDDDVPTLISSGPHRPLWPQFGEYTFLPRQRWLHNLEHGSVVMLYHPCANPREVNILKKLVRNCLFRHIITPHNLLKPERPLALVTWGYRLEMSKVDPDLVTEFIIHRALKGPEDNSFFGQFKRGLTKVAFILSDDEDRVLCPNRTNY